MTVPAQQPEVVVGGTSEINGVVFDGDNLVDRGVYVYDQNSNKFNIESIKKKTLSIPAGAMVPSETNGATTGTYETTTNKQTIDYFAFPSGSSGYSVDVELVLEDWDGLPFKAYAKWTAPAGSTIGDTVETRFKAVAVNNNEVIDAAFGDAVSVVDTLLANDGDKDQVTPKSAAITAAGNPTAGSSLHFRIDRGSGDGSDMSEDMWIKKVVIEYGKIPHVAW